MSNKALVAALLVVVFTATVLSGNAADCSSPTGCTDCFPTQLGFKCDFVDGPAYCSCEVSTFGGTASCGVDGDCDYTGSIGGGGGGGGTGGDPACVRLNGQWCPPECSSCETVFWY